MTGEQRRAAFSSIDGMPPLKAGQHEIVRHQLYKAIQADGMPLDSESAAFVEMLLREFCPGYGDC